MTQPPARRPAVAPLAVLAVLVLAVGAALFVFLGPAFAPPGDGSFTVVDDRGTVLSFDGPPQRIVSIAASSTEIVCAIGICDRLVALDQASDHPPEVAQVTLRVYGHQYLDREGLRVANPDVILASGINAPDLDVLEKELGYRVVVLDPADLNGVIGNVRLVGQLTGADAAADAVADALQERVDHVRATVADVDQRPRVYYEIDSTGGYWTFGPGSFGHALIGDAGGQNIAAHAPAAYVPLSSEEVVAADPQVIALAWSASWGGTDPSQVESRPGWDQIAAVREGRLVQIDDDLMSRTGPRLVDGLEALAAYIHPDLFPDAA